MDEEETKDTTDYVATITPELLNLSKCEYDFTTENECHVKSKSCSFMLYFFAFILFFILLQIILKLKLVYYKVETTLCILKTLAFKVEYIFNNLKKNEKPLEKPTNELLNEFSPNLNYILDFIQQIDRKPKFD
jgi:hypothetical protein